MKIGSIVETVADFSVERENWALPYPKKGEVLTVSAISEHHNKRLRKLGIVLLNFEEIPNILGICDKKANGTPNFIELLLPPEIEDILAGKKARTLTEICVDADNHCKDIGYLRQLWTEVIDNRKHYGIVEIKFMFDHIKGHAKMFISEHLKNLLKKK